MRDFNGTLRDGWNTRNVTARKRLWDGEHASRATQYVKYDARVRAEWMNIIRKHFPKSASKLGPLDADVLKTAKEFKSKAHWTGEGGQAKNDGYRSRHQCPVPKIIELTRLC